MMILDSSLLFLGHPNISYNPFQLILFPQFLKVTYI